MKFSVKHLGCILLILILYPLSANCIEESLCKPNDVKTCLSTSEERRVLFDLFNPKDVAKLENQCIHEADLTSCIILASRSEIPKLKAANYGKLLCEKGMKYGCTLSEYYSNDYGVAHLKENQNYCLNRTPSVKLACYRMMVAETDNGRSGRVRQAALAACKLRSNSECQSIIKNSKDLLSAKKGCTHENNESCVIAVSIRMVIGELSEVSALASLIDLCKDGQNLFKRIEAKKQCAAIENWRKDD